MKSDAAACRNESSPYFGALGLAEMPAASCERLSEASTGSRPTWPAAAAGPVRRTLSRVGLGSIIRVIVGLSWASSLARKRLFAPVFRGFLGSIMRGRRHGRDINLPP